MSSQVRVERDGNVAIVIIDNPPINAGSSEVRGGLLAAVNHAAATDAALALGLIDRVVSEDLRGAATVLARELHGRKRRVRVRAVPPCDPAAIVHAASDALRAGDIDVVMVNGYGFPRWEGGPMFWGRERGAEALRADLGWLAALSGPGFIRADVSTLFR